MPLPVPAVLRYKSGTDVPTLYTGLDVLLVTALPILDLVLETRFEVQLPMPLFPTLLDPVIFNETTSRQFSTFEPMPWTVIHRRGG